MEDIERRNEILAYLKQFHSANVNFLAKKFYASPSTIRRDLTFLQKTGMVHRTHGGVIYNDRFKELSILVRKEKNEETKHLLTKKAVEFVPEFSSIFLDNSSTCFNLIKLLDLNNKLIVTNSLLIVQEVDALYDAKVVFLGGDYDIDNMSVSGPLTDENLSRYHFDLMCQSCAYVNAKGAYENEYKTANIKRIARENSDFCMLLFDATKLETSASCKSSSLQNFNVIVSNMDKDKKEEFLRENPNLNIQLI